MPWGLFYVSDPDWSRSSLWFWIQGPPGLRLGVMTAESCPGPKQRAAGGCIGLYLMVSKPLLP